MPERSTSTQDTPLVQEGYRLPELHRFLEERRVAWLGQIIESQQRKASLPKACSGSWKCPFFRTANALWGNIDLTVDDEMRFEPTEGQRLALQAGESQVCKRGDTRRVAIWMGEVRPGFHQDHLHGLRAKGTPGRGPASPCVGSKPLGRLSAVTEGRITGRHCPMSRDRGLRAFWFHPAVAKGAGKCAYLAAGRSQGCCRGGAASKRYSTI